MLLCAKMSFVEFVYLAPLPQLDRGLGYEPRRRGFESLKARHNSETEFTFGIPSLFYRAIWVNVYFILLKDMFKTHLFYFTCGEIPP